MKGATEAEVLQMQGMRDILKASVSKGLQNLSREDKIAAAWTIACGPSLARRGAVVGFSEGVINIEVADAMWLRQMKSMETELQKEISRIAGVPITGIHFEVKKI
jgi:predicted nucleic acid-binding Zn ribbon protein